MLDELRREVCNVNRELPHSGLVTLTWGNASGIDRERGLVAIKPSGVAYDRLKPEDVVVVDLDGKIVEGRLRPSSDTAIHLAIYRGFASVGGITHTHSRYATMFAQARRDIACLGTTHADHFAGPVPVTRALSEAEVAGDYEAAVGRVIVEHFLAAGLDPMAIPAVLAASHGPFAWGCNATDSLHNAIALEAVAEIAVGSYLLQSQCQELERHVLEKHYRRKHGPSAYYGQQ